MSEATVRTDSPSKLLQKDEDVYLEVKEYLSSEPEVVEEEEGRFRAQMRKLVPKIT